MRRRILYITAFCIYIGAILYLCLTKPDNLPQTELLIFGLPADKVAHFTMFLPFPILIYLIFFDRSQNKWKDMLILAAALAMGTGAAFGTEYLQGLTQYRSSDIQDAFADMKGLSTGALIVIIHILLRKRTA